MVKTLTIIHINFGFKETSRGCFVGTRPRRVAQVLLAGHPLDNVQVHRPPKHPPEEVNDTVGPNEARQDVQSGEDSQADPQPLPHDGVLARNLGSTPRRPAIALVVPPLAVTRDGLYKALLSLFCLVVKFKDQSDCHMVDDCVGDSDVLRHTLPRWVRDVFCSGVGHHLLDVCHSLFPEPVVVTLMWDASP